MNDNFENVVKFTLNNEKARTNDPNDIGGLTIWGFASRYWPTEVNLMKTMSPEDAKKRAVELYYNNYWFTGGCNLLPILSSQVHFDACVNPGLGAAIKFLQIVVGAKEDGSLGPNTRKLIDAYVKSPSFNDKDLAVRLVELRERYYKDKNNIRYVHGWLNRCKDLKLFLKLV